MKFPTLYKKTSTGAYQFWEIWTCAGGDGHKEYCTIMTKYGQLDTDSPQTTEDLIKSGKNLGKRNETNAYQQAEAEAKARWEKKKKSGYVETLTAAINNEVDALIEGGIVPMLAHKFSEHGHKIKFPCYTQPKLDGIRCIAIIKDGACTLWSRTRKPINSMPHIVAELEAIFSDMDIAFDGELYNHALKSNFEKIVSMVRQEEPHADHAIVQYHIYDMCSLTDTFQQRMEILWELFDYLGDTPDDTCLRLVDTQPVNSEDDIMVYFEQFVNKGYEGSMLRNRDSKYVNKRSYDLLKVKEFDDAEFPIVQIEEGRGRLTGHVGAFVCVNGDGTVFKAKAKGATEKLREYFEDHSLWQGKKLTVQYQGLTGKEKVPRFPVGIRIRDDE